ncbi:MAG: histidine kinase [Cyclobacteriaceae bacterium]|nr:histidine kinase [Cyclobacteriaceae bacterium]
MKKFGLLAIICTSLGVLFFIYIFYSNHGRFPSLKWEAYEYAICIVITNMAGFLAWKIDILLDRWIHWRTHFLARFLSGYLINGILVLAFAITANLLLLGARSEDMIKLGILLAITLFIYEIFYGLLFSYQFYAKNQVENMRLDRLQLELQFESLKSQISPHYLFNCLNTVSSLLFKDAFMAEQFIRRMADTFRYVIDNQKQKLVTVREEIEFVKAYYYLLQVRYEQHLSLEFNLPKSLYDTFIPPMTLQLLVENAVKHNKISKDNPLLIYISAQDNTRILVANSKTIAEKSESFRIGLTTITSRYQFFTEEKVLIKNEARFTVILPVLKRNVKQERYPAFQFS